MPRSQKHYLVAILILLCCGCTNFSSETSNTVTLSEYNTHTAAEHLEFLHNASINNMQKYREGIEQSLSSEVIIIWSGINNKDTTPKDKEQSYKILRLIAVQNEKYPIAAINSNPDAVSILNKAIENDEAHTKWLRSQDWTKPKWSPKSCEEK